MIISLIKRADTKETDVPFQLGIIVETEVKPSVLLLVGTRKASDL